MRPRKLKTVLVIACVLAMGAGVFAGMVVSRLPMHPTETVLPIDHSELADELQLTPGQRDQMRAVWENVRTQVHDTYDEAQSLQKQRDDQVVAMLTPEQKLKYAEITTATADKFSALSRRRDTVFHDGVEKTKTLLDDSQKQKYERILRDRIGTVPGGYSNPAQPASTQSGTRSGASSGIPVPNSSGT